MTATEHRKHELHAAPVLPKGHSSTSPASAGLRRPRTSDLRQRTVPPFLQNRAGPLLRPISNLTRCVLDGVGGRAALFLGPVNEPAGCPGDGPRGSTGPLLDPSRDTSAGALGRFCSSSENGHR